VKSLNNYFPSRKSSRFLCHMPSLCQIFSSTLMPKKRSSRRGLIFQARRNAARVSPSIFLFFLVRLLHKKMLHFEEIVGGRTARDDRFIIYNRTEVYFRDVSPEATAKKGESCSPLAAYCCQNYMAKEQEQLKKTVCHFYCCNNMRINSGN